MVQKIISGGQTGVDRAALDAAMALGIEVAGWCPKGRLAEDGKVPEKYPLKEMDTSSYPTRTEQNVIDSDGTLIIYWGKMSGGTALTFECAFRHKRPCFSFNMERPAAKSEFTKWFEDCGIENLNIAGPRGSRSPDVYPDSLKVIKDLLS
jgi:hypothetical protein